MWPYGTLRIWSAIILLVTAAVIPAQTIKSILTRGSVNALGLQGNGHSAYTRLYWWGRPSLSKDGRYVAFCSEANNLVINDMNGQTDVFVKDTWTGQVRLVSVSSSGVQGNNESANPRLTPDGRFVVFTSLANNLVPGDTDGDYDVFVRDLVGQTTTRVSVSSGGPTNSNGGEASITADGRYVAFSSIARLTADDSDNNADVYLRDTLLGFTTKVSVGLGGAESVGDCSWPVITPDGSRIAFHGVVQNLVQGDTNNRSDVFLWERSTGAITRISVSDNGTQANAESELPSISDNGRYVVFDSGASNLVAGDTSTYDVFLRDTANSTTVKLTSAPNGVNANNHSYFAFLSGDGRYVTYQSDATNLVVGDTNGKMDVYVTRLSDLANRRVSIALNGTQPNLPCMVPSISERGQKVAFISQASNLVANDTGGYWDVFLTGPVLGQPHP